MSSRCTMCSKIVKSRHLDMHMKYVHKHIMSCYKCTAESCGRTYSTLKALSKHSKTHTVPSRLQTNKEFHSTYNLSGRNANVELDTGNFLSDKENGYSMDVTDDVEKIEEFPDDSILHKIAIELVSSCYADPTVTLKFVQHVIFLFDQFLNCSYLNAIKQQVLECNTREEKDIVLSKIEKFQSVLKSLNTKHKRIVVLEASGYYIKPQRIFFDSLENNDGSGNLSFKEARGQIIVLGSIFKVFLELPSVFSAIREYYVGLENCDRIHNIVQTDFWKSRIMEYPERIIFPLLMYEDAYETGNPLGSHAGVYSLSAIYVLFACLPPKFRARLINIFLAQLYHADDGKTLGSDTIYRRIISDLNVLNREGIEISVDGKNFRVYFQVILIIADNLALNTMLGFAGGFSANMYCRFCRVTSEKASGMTKEVPSLLRTIKNYESDLKKKNLFETGINEECVFNSLQDFHAVTNFSSDTAHDIHLGIGKNEVGEMLYDFVLVKKYFTLEILNWRIKWFPFKGNHAPLISQFNLKSKNIKMTAAEMQHFILNASLIFGDLVPEDDEQWKLFILLRKIVVLTLLYSITEADCDTMKVLVEKHHTLFIKLYGKTLKPKHHFMLHYHLIMRKVGPLRWISCMRCEAKHRPSKTYARVTFNRKDLCFSLANKHQLSLCDVFLRERSFECDKIKLKVITSNLCYSEKLVLPNKGENHLSLKFVEVDGIKYTQDAIVLISPAKNGKFPLFGVIEKIYCKHGNIKNVKLEDFIIIASTIETCSFSDHFQAYAVGEPLETKILDLKDIADRELWTFVLMPNGFCYVLYDELYS